jgi:hypothetical protein
VVNTGAGVSPRSSVHRCIPDLPVGASTDLLGSRLDGMDSYPESPAEAVRLPEIDGRSTGHVACPESGFRGVREPEEQIAVSPVPDVESGAYLRDHRLHRGAA